MTFSGITVFGGENLSNIFTFIDNNTDSKITCVKNIENLRKVIDNDNISHILIVNPENGLHPKWQTDIALIAVKWAKEFNKNILITTNSFHFLEALTFYIEQYYDNFVKYYMVYDKNTFSVSDDPYDIMKSLSQPSFDLADMKFKFENSKGEFNNE